VKSRDLVLQAVNVTNYKILAHASPLTYQARPTATPSPLLPPFLLGVRHAVVWRKFL
jgi:hypothetical protein